MNMTIDQQVALDEALVPHASRVRIGKSKFRLGSDIKSKESTLQVETATVHHHSNRFKMNNKKRIVNLEYFREMLQISPRIPNQQFNELPFKEEILAFLKELGHSEEIKMIIDVNINKLHQPWRSFAAVINKCLSGKSIGYDSLCLSQAQILWGMYHKKNVDFTYLLWEDFLYQVEHKDAKKSNEMYYPRFIKVIVNFFMTKDQSIIRRNKYGVILSVELTNKAIRHSESYKEYYAVASGAEHPKTKASVRKKQSSFDTTVPPPTKGKRLKILAKVDKPAKEKQPAKLSTKGLTVLSEVALTEAEQIKLATKKSLTQTHISHASGLGADEGTSIIPRVLDVPNYESDDEEISWKSSDEDEGADDDDDDQNQDDQDNDDDEQTDSDNDSDDFVHPKFSTHDEEAKDEESFDPMVQTPSHDDKDDDEDSDGMIVKGDEGANEENDADELYRDVNINLEGRDIQMADVQTTQVIEDTHVTLTPINPEGQQESSFVSSLFVSNMLNLSPDTGIDSIFDSTPRVDVPVSTAAEPPLLSATTLPLPTISIIPHVQQTIALSPVNVLSSSLQDLPNFGSLFGFDHRLKTLETNFSEFLQTNQFAKAVSSILGIIDKYIDHQMNEDVKKLIKVQVKVQVSKILPKIKKTVNEQLEAEVLTRSSNSFKTSYAIAVDLSELELKKILIEKMESNKSVHRFDEQKNLYKALVDTYECDKLILDTYGDTVILKRQSTSAPKEKTSNKSGKSTEGSKSQNKIASEFGPAEEPTNITQDLEEPAPQEFKIGATDDQSIEEPWINNLAKKADSRTSFNELMDTPVDFLAFMMNRLKVDTLTPDLLADWNNPEGQQYPHDLLKPLPLISNSQGRRVIPFDHFINNDFEYLRGGASSQKYTTSVTKTKATDYGHIKWIKDLFYGFAVNKESARDVYSKRRIIVVTELQIIEWHNYKHLDWITIRRDDDKLYKFKECDFKRLRIQDIKDMLLLLVQGKLTNLTVDERFTFNVSLRMFTRSIVIQRRVKDLQLGVESYQKKLNLIKLDTYSDDTLNDVRTALDDRLKGIQMQYLPQIIWRRSDKDRAAAMIQAIDRQLKTRRIMRSLEKFDCDGIPKRSTMYLNLWSYKAVRHRYSNLIIQPEPKGFTQGYPLVSIEVL
nr:hypothetical protein [Tanacetum cinerariifolium]